MCHGGNQKSKKDPPPTIHILNIQAEIMLASDDTIHKEYLSMGGLQSFTDAAMKLILG